MKKSLLTGALLCGVILSVSGCSNAIPEMDEETQEIIVEYAAATVRKYDTNRTARLLEYQEMEELNEKEREKEELKKQQEEAAKEENALAAEEKHTALEQVVEEAVPATLEDVIKIDEISITYTGYETDDFYPSEGSGTYFAMNATEGNRLLVLKFNIKNLTQMEKEINLLEKNIRYKIIVNGETKNALTTMLLNDLSNTQETYAAGEEKEVVLVCEIPEGQADQIGDLSIIVKNEDETATISLN